MGLRSFRIGFIEDCQSISCSMEEMILRVLSPPSLLLLIVHRTINNINKIIQYKYFQKNIKGVNNIMDNYKRERSFYRQ